MQRCPWTLLLAGGALLLLAVSPAVSQESASAEDCAACHEEHVDEFGLTVHSALDSEGLASLAGTELSCTACHGDPTAHLDAGGGEENIFNYGEEEPVLARTERCQSCHADSHPRFLASAHARQGMDCTSCHQVHQPVSAEWEYDGIAASGTWLRPGSVSASCSECHADVFAQFELNERHRLQEGILECTDCHDPHKPSTRIALGGFKQEACVSCHTDKGGPFVFEHGASRVEGCSSCHEVHGSPNRHLLTFQNVADQCYSCHTAVPGFHFFFPPDIQCTNCHSTIHGSNFDPFFLK